ncbi:MAG: PTS sugar transporter subunit IIA [Candidatus Cloacimonetes bacterium]|nr:PTS sugar transporter subunit IIA [Candidatus Cloacimonadota bacterium]
MNFSDVLKLECCELSLKANSKDETLQHIAQIIKKSPLFKNINTDKIYDAFKEREDRGSTGFGRGIAIPHCQLDGIDKFVVGIAISKKGIDFDSLDKKKSKIFVFIVGPKEDRTTHLKLLAKVSHVLKEPHVTDNLIKSSTIFNLYEEFIRHTDADSVKLSKKGKEKLMLMIVRDEDIMFDITEVLVEFGIEDATIIETQKMENLISKVPLFLGFFNFTGGSSPFGKIILLHLQKSYMNAVVQSLEMRFGDLDSFSGLSIMVVDLLFSKGF